MEKLNLITMSKGHGRTGPLDHLTACGLEQALDVCPAKTDRRGYAEDRHQRLSMLAVHASILGRTGVICKRQPQAPGAEVTPLNRHAENPFASPAIPL